jgi:thiamine biosynthesis lipoprotein
MRLDLGGIAKGDTAAQVVHWLNSFGPCLVDAGGDLTAGDAPNGLPGWPVGIAAPWGSAVGHDDLMRLWLCHQSLATSGIDYRRWQQHGREHHHIIDPRTQLPAVTDLLTVSVLTDEATTAEAWATAMLVAGSDASLWLLQERGLAAAVIDQESRLLLTPALRPLVQFEFLTPDRVSTEYLSSI